MGNYLKQRGEQVKLGTCENLYYTRFHSLNTAHDIEGDKEHYLRSDQYRFRFPFPDEDRMFRAAAVRDDVQDHDRGVRLQVPVALLVSVGFFDEETMPPQADLVELRLHQQRPLRGYLFPVFEIGDKGYPHDRRFRVEDPAHVCAIASGALQTYVPPAAGSKGLTAEEMGQMLGRMMDGVLVRQYEPAGVAV